MTKVCIPSLKASCRLVLASLLCLLLLCTAAAHGAQVTLAWDPNTDPKVAGYRLYWGTERGQYDLLSDVGNCTNAVASSLQNGKTYFFVVTVYDDQGNESAHSNEVSYCPPETSNLSDYFDIVQKLYVAYYHRPADPAGLIFWAERLYASGGNVSDIAEGFSNSTEFQALYGTINSDTVSAVVNGIYNALFVRDAEPEGLAYYVNGFNSGRFTAATMIFNLLYGAQNADLQSVNNKFVAANLFTRIIDPELDGVDLQVTYAGEKDATSGRNFLVSVSSDPATVPNQDQIIAYLKSNVAYPGDPILNH